ncbi:hypothetical protein [Parendozoicomonas sp. Alg238-R29]|uniref:hypothetical protein n=1 Tax=Parendozoicomonas sp. Alg238-R29 TaxID=2993446 RepID=UPI00248D3ED4|nr:hypothetical protein [Parendozoicomonas sp. Alg238-R29]
MFVAIAAALSSTVYAAEQQAVNGTTLLNQVTVTATRTEKQLRDVAGSVTVINSEQLENQLSQNIW